MAPYTPRSHAAITTPSDPSLTPRSVVDASDDVGLQRRGGRFCSPHRGRKSAAGNNGRLPGTVLVNLTGSLLLGFLLARRARAMSGPWAARFWGIGVFGSYTTFSAFSLDVVHLIDHERLLAAGGYVVASVLGGLLLALVGQRIGETLP